MSRGETINKLEDAISESKKDITFNDALQRLKNNPDFKHVIMDRYIRDRSLNLVSLRGNPTIERREQEQADMDIIAIGRLNYFMDTVEYNAQSALSTIDAALEQIAVIEKQTDEDFGDE